MRKIGCVAACLPVLFAPVLSGCSMEREDVVVAFSSDEELLSIDGVPCPVSYAKVFLCNYQNIYGSAYGMSLWEHDFGDKDLTEYVKEVSLSELSRVLSMDALAATRGIVLGAKEQEKAASAAEEYYASLNDAEKEYMEIDVEGLTTLYEDYALAEVLYNTLTEGVNYEVSEDEARVMTVQEIFVTDEETARLITTALSEGTDFATLAAQYTEDDQVEKNVKRGDLPAEAEAAAYALDDEEISEMVESGGGWYCFKCVNKNVEELTQENKNVIAQEREKEASDTVYEAYVSELSSTLNADLWESVEPDTSGAITTDSFFTVYDNYFQ